MKTFVKACAVACLAALVASGSALADSGVKKQKPGFLERLFTPKKRDTRKEMSRNLFGWKNNRDALGVPGQGMKAASATTWSDADPEPDPGLGMGNLTYVAPKLAALSALKLSEPRPADPAAGAIHDQLTGENASLRVLPMARDAILDQYRSQAFRPIWLADGTLSPRGAAVLRLLSSAADDGLDPQAYLPGGLAGFDAPLPVQDPAAMARLDIDLTAAALRYARDASGGQFDPNRLSRYHDVKPGWVPASQAMKVLAWSPFPADYLKSLHPNHPAYAAMKTALAEARGAAPVTVSVIEDGPVVKKGGNDERIPSVRQRLEELGYVAAMAEDGDPTLLDAELSVQLRLFQKTSGIKVSGALGPQTVTALNTSRAAVHADILVDNMERLRWLPRDLGNRYVFVNQPAFEAKVVENGRTIWESRVIVGRPTTQTYLFHDEMEYVVFNPSWGVPQSIIRKDYLPKLRRDPGYLDRMGFKVVNQNGKVVPSRSINWASYGSRIPFGVHQPPGEDNALGEVKFLFPNSHDIYMHDTPNRELFDRDERAFSHGCVRVQNPRDFAAVVLGWSPEEVDAHLGTPKTETITLKTKLPVHVTYFTAWPDADGRIRYFKDIYGRDATIQKARSAVLVAQR